MSSVVLRNYMAQTAIDHAEKGDYGEVKHIFSLLQKPFDDWPDSDVTSSHVAPGESYHCHCLPVRYLAG